MLATREPHQSFLGRIRVLSTLLQCIWDLGVTERIAERRELLRHTGRFSSVHKFLFSQFEFCHETPQRVVPSTSSPLFVGLQRQSLFCGAHQIRTIVLKAMRSMNSKQKLKKSSSTGKNETNKFYQSSIEHSIQAPGATPRTNLRQLQLCYFRCGPSPGNLRSVTTLCTKKYSRYVERERRSKMADIRSPPMLIFLMSSAPVNKSLGIAESGVLYAL